MNIYSIRRFALLGPMIVAAGALATTGCSSSGSGSGKSTSTASAGPTSSGSASGSLTMKQIVLGTTLHHQYQVNGKGAVKTEFLAQPDDITPLAGHIYVGFQNGVGSQGEPSTSGNTASTIVEFTRSGSLVKQWDVIGKVDGMGSDPQTGQVIATVNEDSNSSLYAISGADGTVTRYTYAAPLAHKGGTDAIAFYNGRLLISASAPGTSGKAPASASAVLMVTLNPAAKVAQEAPFFPDDATATGINGSHAGASVTLALTDPDSSTVVPSNSPAYGGDYVLNSQGDQELIFSGSGKLSVLKLPTPVDDIAWATSATGSLYTTDSSSDTVDVITGTFTPGTVYTSVTPCNANSAPTACPAPGFPANSLGTVNLKTGALGSLAVIGPFAPKGLIFMP
jgi:hypothetical protein